MLDSLFELLLNSLNKNSDIFSILRFLWIKKYRNIMKYKHMIQELNHYYLTSFYIVSVRHIVNIYQVSNNCKLNMFDDIKGVHIIIILMVRILYNLRCKYIKNQKIIQSNYCNLNINSSMDQYRFDKIYDIHCKINQLHHRKIPYRIYIDQN